MKTFSLSIAVLMFMFAPAVTTGQEEPVKPAAEPQAAVKQAPQQTTAPASPQHKKHLSEPVVSQGKVQELQGEVSGLGKNSISVVSYRDENGETEMVFPFDPKKLRIEHKKSISEISTGDIVLVRYLAETDDYGDDQKTNTKTISIAFIKPADATSEYKVKPSEPAEEPDANLPLKGVK